MGRSNLYLLLSPVAHINPSCWFFCLPLLSFFLHLQIAVEPSSQFICLAGHSECKDVLGVVALHRRSSCDGGHGPMEQEVRDDMRIVMAHIYSLRRKVEADQQASWSLGFTLSPVTVNTVNLTDLESPWRQIWGLAGRIFLISWIAVRRLILTVRRKEGRRVSCELAVTPASRLDAVTSCLELLSTPLPCLDVYCTFKT